MLFIKAKGDLLPDDAEAIISICEKIIDQHQNLGPASPLGMKEVASLSLRAASAKEKHSEGMKYKKLMESSWRERDQYLVGGDKDLVTDLRAIYSSLKERDLDVNSWGF